MREGWRAAPAEHLRLLIGFVGCFDFAGSRGHFEGSQVARKVCVLLLAKPQLDARRRSAAIRAADHCDAPSTLDSRTNEERESRKMMPIRGLSVRARLRASEREVGVPAPIKTRPGSSRPGNSSPKTAQRSWRIARRHLTSGRMSHDARPTMQQRRRLRVAHCAQLASCFGHGFLRVGVAGGPSGAGR